MPPDEPCTISRHPEYGWRWWTGGETLPAIEQGARPATDAETALIRRIMRAADQDRPADKPVSVLLALMEGAGHE